MVRCIFNLRTTVEGGFSYKPLFLIDRAPSEMGVDTEYPPVVGDALVLNVQDSSVTTYRVVDRGWWFYLPMRHPMLDVVVEEAKSMYADNITSESEKPLKEHPHHD